jgi:hypothetical protein
MKKNYLFIVGGMIFCLLLAQNASASYTSKTIYLDGQYVADVCGSDTLDFGGVIRVGAAGGDGWIFNEYIGKLAEFAVYKSILSSSRILAHYSAKDSNNAYTAAVNADNPVLWLRFRDASTDSGATAKNSGSSSTNGRYFISGGAPMSIVDGISADSNALYISEADSPGHKVEVADNGEFDASQVTVEIWVNFTGIGAMPDNDYPVLFTTAGGPGILMNQDGNAVNVQGGGETFLDLPYDINDGQWHNIAITYNSVYQAPVLPSAAAYNQEVAADHPVIWLKFDISDPCNSGEDANHWVGYGTGGSIVAKTGGVGKSLLCSGMAGGGVYDAAVAAGPNAPQVVNETYAVFDDNYAFAPNDITFEIWYKSIPGSPPGDFAYFYQQTGTYNNEPCAPAVGNSQGQFRVFGGSTGWYTGVPTKFDGQWHHLVVTYDENNVDPCNMIAQLYLDGFLKGTNSFSGPHAKLGPEMYHMLIGGRADIGFTYNEFRGYLDEFAVYKGILDPNRVMAHYSAWQYKNCEDMLNRDPGFAGDVNRDCKVNFYDFAELASDWLQCDDPNVGAPRCPPNW